MFDVGYFPPVTLSILSSRKQPSNSSPRALKATGFETGGAVVRVVASPGRGKQMVVLL
jgi:hypothetical protein